MHLQVQVCIRHRPSLFPFPCLWHLQNVSGSGKQFFWPTRLCWAFCKAGERQGHTDLSRNDLPFKWLWVAGRPAGAGELWCTLGATQEKVALRPQVALPGLQLSVPKGPGTWRSFSSAIKCESRMAPLLTPQCSPHPIHPCALCCIPHPYRSWAQELWVQRGVPFSPEQFLKHFSSQLGKTKTDCLTMSHLLVQMCIFLM